MTISIPSDWDKDRRHVASHYRLPDWAASGLEDSSSTGLGVAGLRLLENSARGGSEASSGCCPDYQTIRLVSMLSQMRQLDHALEILDSVEEAGGDPPRERTCPAYKIARANLLVCAGDFRGAFEAASCVVSGAYDTCLRKWAPLGHFVLALAALRLGNLSAAIQNARRLELDSVFSRETFLPGQAAWVIVQAMEAEAGGEKALPLVAEMLASPPVVRELLISQPAAVPWLVRFLVSWQKEGLTSDAVTLARAVAAENPGFLSVEAAALHGEALHSGDVGQLKAVAEMHQDRWAQASAIEDVGVRLAGQESRFEEAVDSLERAKHCYREMGAMRDFARVKSRLRDIGAKQNPRNSGRPRSGIPSLTATEYSVAKLVAQGFTNVQTANQLFLSQHTVAFHLRKIFRKIGVESRVQLAGTWNSIDTAETISQ